MASAQSLDRGDKPQRWWRGLLVASLALNLLIAGAVLGGAWVMRLHGGPFGVMRHSAAGPVVGPVGRFIGALPPERRSALREMIAQYQGASVEFNHGMAAARHDAADALLTTPFDRAKFETALKRVYDAELAGRTAMIPATGNVVEHLTGAEREMFLHMLRWQQGVGVDGRAADASGETKSP